MSGTTRVRLERRCEEVRADDLGGFPCPICRLEMELHPGCGNVYMRGPLYVDSDGFNRVIVNTVVMRCPKCGAVMLRERPVALSEVHDS